MQAKHEHEALSALQCGISRAADAILLKDDPDRRRALIDGANSAYNRALQLMIQSPRITSAQVQRNLAHLEALLRRLEEDHPEGAKRSGEFGVESSAKQQCVVCLETGRQ